MFPEVLSNHQRELLPILKGLSKKFYLVGGTAIALQIGHRRSIDFAHLGGHASPCPGRPGKVEGLCGFIFPIEKTSYAAGNFGKG